MENPIDYKNLEPVEKENKNSTKEQQKNKNPKITRRGFLKLAALAGAEIAIGYKIGDFLKKGSDKFEELSEEFWYSVIEDVSRNVGEEITPQEIRANLITKILRIPQGWTSGLWTENVKNDEGKYETRRSEPELDKLIAEYFTNSTVKIYDTEHGPITSSDPRDFSSMEKRIEEFREKVEKLNSGKEEGLRIYKVIKSELDYLNSIDNKESDSYKRDQGVELVWMPGGVPVFLRGYVHIKAWQDIHGKHLAETYENADYIAIEGGSDTGFGEALDMWWSDTHNQQGHYDQLMKCLVKNGFDGHFLEVDGRDASKVITDNFLDSNDDRKIVDLPDEFYEKYLKYLKKENASLAEKIVNVSSLKKALVAQSTSAEGRSAREKSTTVYSKNKDYHAAAALHSKDFSISTTPTGMELGQMAFADALAALKLHTLSQAMNEGVIKKGIVADFEGSHHLSFKSFFIKYPQYAAEIVLRNVHELMAGYAGEKLTYKEIREGKNRPENLKKIYEIFEKQNYGDIIDEIGRIPLAHIEKDSSKTVEVGPSQKRIIHDKAINVFDGIDMDILFALYDDEYIQKEVDKWKKRNKK